MVVKAVRKSYTNKTHYWEGLRLNLVPLTRPAADLHPWASITALPQGDAQCPGPWLSLAALCPAPSWSGELGSVLMPLGGPSPRETPAPQHPHPGNSSFPILLPCCRITMLNAIANLCLPNLFLTDCITVGTTCLHCRRQIPNRIEKGIFHFEMEFCFDNFISLMLYDCETLEYLDCSIIAVSGETDKNISYAYVAINVTQGPQFIFLVLVCF